MVGNTHDLQNRQSELGDWFMSMAAIANPRVTSGQTAQGFYVIGADGTAYGYNNNRSVERVMSFMAEGLKGYKAAPAYSKGVRDLDFTALTAPKGSAVLRVYARILPVPEGSHASNENVQRDHFWILPDEVSALAKGDVAESLQLRLCRFAFVDAIRGEPNFWKPSEIVSRSFKVRRDGDGYHLTGTFEMRHAQRGIEGSFEALIKVDDGKIVSFRGFAETVAHGRSTYTPNPPKGEFDLKLAFVLAPSTADTVAPQAAMYGRSYLTGS